MSEALSSVQNAVRVLKAFSSRQRDYGVTELARTLDLSTSTVHRLLRTLQGEHLVEQDKESGRYRSVVLRMDNPRTARILATTSAPTATR